MGATTPSAPPLPAASEAGSLGDWLPSAPRGGALRASFSGTPAGSVLIRPPPPAPERQDSGGEDSGYDGSSNVGAGGEAGAGAAGAVPFRLPGWVGDAAGVYRAPMPSPPPESPQKPCPRSPSTTEQSLEASPSKQPLLPVSSGPGGLAVEPSGLLPEASRCGIDAAEAMPGAGVTAYITISSGSEKEKAKPTGARPSRTAALRQRHARQLQQTDKDQFGVPVAATARPFSLWASPQKIGEASTGLGIHFASMRAFVAVALLLSLVAIYPLVDDLQTDRWAPTYTLVLNQVPVASCIKPWSTHNWITATTIGGHCSSAAHNSAYECAATCSASTARLAAPQCAGQAWRPAARNFTRTCAQHAPCNPDVTDPAHPNGPCHCCDLALDTAVVDSNPEVPAAQLWTFLIGQVAFLVWMIALARMQLAAMHKVDARVVTASDYSVLITHLNPGSVTDKVVQEWCRHYGPVTWAANIMSFGSAVKVGREVQRLEVRKAEADAQLHEDCPPAPWLLRPLGWLYWGTVVGSRRRLAQQLESQGHKLEVYQRQEFEPTGAALAVFCYGEHAANCILDHKKSPSRALVDFLSSAYCCCCCWAARCCGAHKPKLAGAVVTVARAPEPSDVIWEHTSVTGARAVGRRLWSWTLTALVILAGLGLQYGLAVLAESERESRVQSQVLVGSPESAAGSAIDFSNWAAFTDSAWAATRLRWISLVTGLTVVVANWSVTLVVRRLSVYERWHTRTSLERWTAVKLTLFYLMNSFGVPVLAAYLSSSSTSWRYSRGGLMESAFWTQCANAVLPPLVNVIGPSNVLFFHLLARFAKTQAMLDWLMSPPEFPLAEQYASAVATLGMGLWWMPVLPVSPMIAAVGLFLAYCADKWVALRRAAHPGNLNGQVTSSAVDVLVRLLPLVQLVLMKELYFTDSGAMVPCFWTGLALWLVFALAPCKRLLGLVRHTRSTATGGLSYQDTLAGGQRGGLDDAYMPAVPPTCSATFRQEATAAFALPPAPLPAIEKPLPYQNPATAGPATRPPQLRASSALAPVALRGGSSQGALSLEASYSAGAAGWPYVPPAVPTMKVAPDPAVGSCAVAMGAVAGGPPCSNAAEVQEGPLARGSRLFSSPSHSSATGSGHPAPGAAAGGEMQQQQQAAAEGGGAPRHVRGMTASWLQQTATWLMAQPGQAAGGAASGPTAGPMPPLPLPPEPPVGQQEQQVHQYRQWRWGGGVSLPGGVAFNVHGETSSGQVGPAAPGTAASP